ncbi:translation initiation factor IF-2 [Candidatus Woesearchaeota archaeon]|nr:translation initiation factor IF-2 [Candidatus Woesearchaeota archaeon]
MADCNFRSPICVLLAHVDHGKTSILDKIRGSAIARGEAGGITQAIGASIIPMDTIQKMCGDMLKSLNMKFTLPGMLFIDSPGHEAFSNLRKRGGNLADIAILVVDVNEGLKPQTIESLEILKQYKTPFVVALNKIDMISGWHKGKGLVLKNINSQDQRVQNDFETKLYNIVGKLSELGFNSDRFDRVDDFTKQIAIVPTSAATGEGISELIMMITGLAQKYLENCLKCDISGQAKGTILEVKESKGLGKTMDLILYDGTLHVNDQIVIGTTGEPLVTKIRALFQPHDLNEMRDKKAKFKSVKHVCAATGVKLAAPGIDNIIAGMPVLSVGNRPIEEVMNQLQSEIDEVIIETGKSGIIIKADTLGSLEALSKILKDKDVPIRKAQVGNISKKDIIDAQSTAETDRLHAVILGFNVEEEHGLGKTDVDIITNSVIYKILEDYEKTIEKRKAMLVDEELSKHTRPAKFQILNGYIFRQSNPAVVGCEIMEGKVKVGMRVMKNDGKTLTRIKSIQLEKESMTEVGTGKKVAISMEKVTVGRQIFEDDIIYSAIPADDFRVLKKNIKHLSKQEVALLKEIAEIKRKNNPVWGV